MFSDIAKTEGVSAEKLEKLAASGRTVIVKNAKRNVSLAIGEATRTKINANLGTSPQANNIDEELKKAKVAVKYGADAVMDLSVFGDLDQIRQKILKEIDVPIGTVPIYQASVEKHYDMTPEHAISTIEKQCKDGIDFITIHSGVTKDLVSKLKGSDRMIPITSKGGAFTAAWMLKTGQENPYYSEFNAILDIAKEYEVTLSLGDGLRPATILDANDYFQNTELETLGKLTKQCHDAGVKVIIEGPGHMPLNTIEENIRLQKQLCHGAPYYVLGPLVTDTAVGHDHISAAIGGAIAAAAGADFLCYVTPSEHIGLPDLEDVKQGVIASKIAAHAGDIVKLKRFDKDKQISEHRKNLNWKGMSEFAMDEKVKERMVALENSDPCSMCGELCALKVCEKHLK